MLPPHGPDLRPPARAALAAPGPPRVDGPRARRPPRGRAAHDPPRRREAPLARISRGGGAGRGRRLPPRAGASCRRCCSTTPRPLPSPSGCALRPRARSRGSRRPRSARSPSSSRCCPPSAPAGSALGGACPPSPPTARGSTPSSWRRSPAPAGTAAHPLPVRRARRPRDPAPRRARAVVHSGYRWYLVAFDLDRDDWRTFRIDRIGGRVRTGERGRRRPVPGGDPAAYVRGQLRTQASASRRPGRVRVAASAAPIAAGAGPLRGGRARRRGRLPGHHPGAWSRSSSSGWRCSASRSRCSSRPS